MSANEVEKMVEETRSRVRPFSALERAFRRVGELQAEADLSYYQSPNANIATYYMGKRDALRDALRAISVILIENA